ncbi:MAG TPA: prolyl oligopeptidase family serine peptidase, partial [Bryobacteraceae bacterium]|nr:prolyl oligopeptidase family serine peptidase [Bryobacteraceae bacterium]
MRLLCLLLATLGALAQTKAPISHEKVWSMKRVGAPVVSPDGRWAIVSATEPSYDASQQASDLWLVATDSSRPPRRLTSTKAPESGVAWSVDSTRIAFGARREGDEVPQIYVLAMDGGEAWRLTKVATGASGPVWRPDGKAILFQSDVYPGANTEEENAKAAAARKSRATSARVWDSYPIASWDKWLTDVHPHLWVQELSPSARPLNLLSHTDLVKQPGFTGNRTADGGEDLEPVWSPDGEWIVFVASTDRDQIVVAQPTTHLYSINVHGGQAKAITSGADSYETPVFSPDGKTLYASQTRGGKDVLYSHGRIARISWPDVSKPQILGGGFDRPISRFRPSGDGHTLYLVAEDAGRDKVYSLAAAGGEVRPVTTGASGVYSGLEVAGRNGSPVLVANWQSMISPPEVVRVDPKTGEHAFLTSFTRADAAAIDWQPPREFWFTAKNGKRIHSFLVLPPAFDESKKYPLLVFMHGGPHQAWKDQWFLRWNYHLLASPGYVVLMTNYTGSPGYGEKFAADINRDVLRGPAGEINEAADEAIRRFGFIDGARQAAGGASYG